MKTKTKLLALSFTLGVSSLFSQVLSYTAVPLVDAAKVYGYGGDGGPAVNALITMPYLGFYDSSGSLYFSDNDNNRIRKVDGITSVITTICGNGTAASTGDGGIASLAEIKAPRNITQNSSGDVFLIENNGHKIRKIDHSTNVITTIAGTGSFGYSGDGGLATSAQIAASGTIKCDVAGNIYFLDFTYRIRKIDALTGIISTVAGNGFAGSTGDGGLATIASLDNPNYFGLDNSGNIYISENTRLRKVDAVTGIINTIAGTGTYGNTGDGGLATLADINTSVVMIDNSGNILIGGYDNILMQPTIRKINSSGIISTYITIDAGSSDRFVTSIDIDPISGYPIVTFAGVCYIDNAINRCEPIYKNVGIQNHDTDNKLIQVYPNPSNGIFTIESTLQTNASVEVFDITGKLVHAQNLMNAKSELNLNLPAGNYTANIKANGVTINKKIVITK